jgi:hypothetical protein
MTEAEITSWPIGQKIVAINYLRPSIFEQEGWEQRLSHPGVELVLEDGSVLYPSADDEGNGVGALFAVDNYQRSVTIHGLKE